jgi:putative tryptophan/tyrosine transport system substrate-binding protein
MSQKIVFLALSAMLLALCIPVSAQQPGKVPRIGLLDSGTASGNAVLLSSFQQELSKLGWVEGKNLVIEYRFGDNKGAERVSALASELVRLHVDLIVASGAGPSVAAKNATTTIPIVMASASDPVAAGLVASLARPGGNVTGLASLSPELNTKRLEILKDAIPKLTRVGFLLAGVGIADDLQLKEIRPAAQSLKLTLEEIEAQADGKSLERAFRTAKQKQVGAIMMMPTRPFFAERKRIIELAGKFRLPAIYSQKEYVDEGGLISYGTDFADGYRRVAYYVDRILKGAKPADLPVEQPKKFEFIINLKAAKQIGLTIPPNVLARADRVIKESAGIKPAWSSG